MVIELLIEEKLDTYGAHLRPRSRQGSRVNPKLLLCSRFPSVLTTHPAVSICSVFFFLSQCPTLACLFFPPLDFGPPLVVFRAHSSLCSGITPASTAGPLCGSAEWAGLASCRARALTPLLSLSRSGPRFSISNKVPETRLVTFHSKLRLAVTLPIKFVKTP